MRKTTLVIMAAGMGSRFGGGIKQLEPLGPEGQTLMEYSIHDAVKAGFNKVVFITRRELLDRFKDSVIKALGGSVDTEFVFQEIDDLPEGYTVDPEGNIDFPVAGKIHVGGLTRHEAQETIKKTLIDSELLKDANVTVETMNLSYTVMGEVNKPGNYMLDKDAVTLFEALGKAGDMNVYGRVYMSTVGRGVVCGTFISDEDTSINTLSAPQVASPFSEGIYDLQGRRYAEFLSVRGIYILNGKKVLIK